MEAEEVYILELTLPDDLAKFVMEQVREGGYANPSEYIQALILADMERRAMAVQDGRDILEI